MVCVDALCPDGGTMFVRIEKTEVYGVGVANRSAAQKPIVGAPLEITVYHVSRHSIDPHNEFDGGMEDTEIRGTYLSLAKANEAARGDLMEEFDMDYFEEYEETVSNGMVTIRAVGLEGEENVYVEKGVLFTGGVQIEGLVEAEESLEESAGESDDE